MLKADWYAYSERRHLTVNDVKRSGDLIVAGTQDQTCLDVSSISARILALFRNCVSYDLDLRVFIRQGYSRRLQPDGPTSTYYHLLTATSPFGDSMRPWLSYSLVTFPATSPSLLVQN